MNIRALRSVSLFFRLSLFVQLSLVLIAAAGCTLVGLVVGGAHDAAMEDYSYVDSWKIEQVKVGDDVELELVDGTKMKGEFQGIQRQPLEQYASLFQSELPASIPLQGMPRPEDSVLIRRSDGTKFGARFLAYDFRLIVLAGRNAPLSLPTSGLSSIEHDGIETSAIAFWEAIRAQGMPLLSQVQLKPDSGATVSLDLRQINRVAIKNHGVLGTYVIVGAAVDAIIVIAAATSGGGGGGGGHSTSTGAGGGSCPFISSFNGKEYVRNSETFSGAIVKGLQHTGTDLLDDLREVSGELRLKLSDELDETQYVDAIHLLAVDHPRGSLVAPATDGTLRLLAHPSDALSAQDLRGHQVASLVRAQDGEYWMSDPSGRDPDDPSSLCDGLELRFARPRGAMSATLLLRLRNTPWATELEKRMLALQGENLPAWYEAMNRSEEQREEFKKLVQDEAMLSVQLWNGLEWANAGTLPFPGPYVWRKLAVDLPLQGIPSGDLRVRLTSVAGLWMIDAASIDCSGQPAPPAHEVPLLRAADWKGKDIRGEISAVDEHYFMMKRGDGADLIYRAPPGNALTRTYVLRANGYYTVHMPMEGPPRWGLISELGKGNGAFGRYATRIFNAWLDSTMAARRQIAARPVE